MDEDIRNTADMLDDNGVPRETIEQTLTRMLDERDNAQRQAEQKAAEQAAQEAALKAKAEAVDAYFNSLFPQRR